MPQLICTENPRNLPRIFRTLAEKAFFRNLNSKHFSQFSYNFQLFRKSFQKFFRAFPKFSEYSNASFHKYCFRCIFSFHRVFFRGFGSVRIHELASRSSYGNIRTPANPYEDRLSTNQILIKPVRTP